MAKHDIAREKLAKLILKNPDVIVGDEGTAGAEMWANIELDLDEMKRHGKEGHDQVYGTDEDKDKKRKRMQKRFDELREVNPHWRKKALYLQLAQEFKYKHPDSVRRFLKTPQK